MDLGQSGAEVTAVGRESHERGPCLGLVARLSTRCAADHANRVGMGRALHGHECLHRRRVYQRRADHTQGVQRGSVHREISESGREVHGSTLGTRRTSQYAEFGRGFIRGHPVSGVRVGSAGGWRRRAGTHRAAWRCRQDLAGLDRQNGTFIGTHSQSSAPAQSHAALAPDRTPSTLRAGISRGDAMTAASRRPLRSARRRTRPNVERPSAR